MALPLDRFLRFDELTDALRALADDHPDLVTVEEYGRSHEGRPLWLVTVTDATTGAHSTKPAHWVDANIHSVEVTGGVAALALLAHLVSGHHDGDPTVVEALRTRTFYVAPRVNPDGVEAALADSPTYRRSSMRPWPWTDRHQWPGLVQHDVDGDGRVLTMRIADPHGAWIEHPEDARVMVPVPVDGVVDPGTTRYRLLTEGTIVDFDGFTIPTPRAPEGLDMNRNFPAGWGTGVTGSGDHPLSEPEIDALVRAITTRPNICGYNAFHTNGGVLLRPSSTAPDSSLPAVDRWTWTELGARGTELTGYRVHSVYEDFTWDRERLMSGAADDWAYEHLGVYGWTTELWDVVHAATGERASTHIWYVGPTVDQELAVARWSDQHGELYLPWRPFEHPQLGPVEIGGADWFRVWTNPPPTLLEAEVAPHARFAVHQALAAPCLEIVHTAAVALGGSTWRIEVGVANTGWLPTTVSARAAKENLVRPITCELELPDGVEIVGGPNRQQLGQLAGRQGFRLDGGERHDGTPDRVLASWVVRVDGEVPTLTAVADHERAGRATAVVALT
ncbi:MAG TPA: M14 family metallopeptidase [Acidimicrobiales bacterium]|nr:M14 family metallopeptidase [Acidimicrobiales bacterium]